MKTLFTFLLVASFSMGLYAQYELPVDFETPEEDTAWTQFANAGDAPENFGLADNPDNSGINTSSKCLKFVVLDNADPWAGAFSNAYGDMEFTADNHIMEMMVHKDKISNCALKIEGSETGDVLELKVPNTKTGEWELLTFDFSDAVGHTYPTLVFFPDFPDSRTEGGTVYVDNIGFQSSVNVENKEAASINIYPNPATDLITVNYPEMNRVVISNVIGQQVKSLEFDRVNRKMVNVSDIKAGIYFVTLETAGETVTTKFIKR